MEIDFERTNEESWLQLKLLNGYECGPSKVGGKWLRSIFEWTAGPKPKNTARKAKEQTEHTPQHIYYFAIFELVIRAFDIHSGWRDASERQRENMIEILSWVNSTHKSLFK
jgi:hypothetical protein